MGDDEYSVDSEKEPPKGIPVPVWSLLNVGVLGAVAGAALSVTPPPNTPGVVVPPSLIVKPNNPGPPLMPKTLPGLPDPPIIPCAQDDACGFILGAVNPVLPPNTLALMNIPGTCQNWSREWLRTGKDTKELEVDRIRQRFAMALMYCEFDGPNWLESDLWVSDLHECDWYTMIGVDPCGDDEKYQVIRNYGQQMRGTLPPEISMLSSLWEITLSGNLLEGPIPQELSKLSLLDTLVLSYNLFEGPIPDFVWKYEDMVYMDLAYNFFNSSIPNSVYMTMPNLRSLFLENNDMAGTIPPEFASTEKLMQLHLDGNKFTGPIPVELFQAKEKFEELFLHGNKFDGSIAPGLADLKSLEKLTLYDNNLVGNIEEVCKNTISNGGKLEPPKIDKNLVECSCCISGDGS